MEQEEQEEQRGGGQRGCEGKGVENERGRTEKKREEEERWRHVEWVQQIPGTTSEASAQKSTVRGAATILHRALKLPDLW
ncbi:unnamed protein product [Pleuronectes platessa]|uniref:Uncharacterized protein n=1 Tax=Pleuronectes platessa TaxID=8262 RepID=A0A9N7W4V8_PLEPL|nr:unnamed protein product [Pleuronectes platessa]